MHDHNKSKDKATTDSSRRRFIAGLSAVGGLAATGAAVSGTRSPATPTGSPDTEPATESLGYQPSEHVQAYYRSLKD